MLQGAGLLAACAAVEAIGLEPRWLDTDIHEAPIPGLPTSLEGYLIGHISDAHLSGLGMIEEAVLTAIKSVSPQLVAITGDAVETEAELPALAELCQEITRSGAAVVATLGNWEHWGRVSLSRLARTYQTSGAQLLINRHTKVESVVGVSGTDDALAGAPLLPGSERGEAVKVLLTHSPVFVDSPNAGKVSFDLCLAGHTHGGQLRLGSLAPFVPPGSGRFVAGWYETPMGRLYVSRGTGSSVIPARFLCRPELPFFRLVKGPG